MDQNNREMIADLKSYLEYLKGLGITEWPLSFIRNETMYCQEVPTGLGGIHELSPRYGMENISQSEVQRLEEVRSELGNCERCKLHRTRRSLVFGEGNEKARLMLIGEGPGNDEDVQGRPFVGKAGQLLTKILQAIEIERKEVYIANIIKCRPPQNRNPEPDEIENCYPFLLKQIQAIRPRIICALGTFSAQTLLKTDVKITTLRGKVYDYSGISLFPTYHPAYLLRNPEKKREVWEDMKQIAKALAESS
ncbi:MAG: uracil-DNA glycosylase [Deltaproteobacteria bacterium]|nr:uracil-DNA glycosylase [Deltaproteobacteria bacterium]